MLARRAGIVLAFIVGSGACGAKKATCIEGASVACACPSGGAGAQVCDADGKFGVCTCSGAADASAGSGSHRSTTSRSSPVPSCIEIVDKMMGLVNDKVGGEIGDRKGMIEQCEKSFTDDMRRCLGGATNLDAVAVCRGPTAKVGAAATASPTKAKRGCPSDANAAAMLKSALKSEYNVTVLKCTPGAFPAAGYVVVAWVGDPTTVDSTALITPGSDDTSTEAAYKRLSMLDLPRLHHAVLRADGTLIADRSRVPTHHETTRGEQTTWARLEAVDFDGDGTDEIIEETEYQRRGWIVGRVEVSLLKRNTMTSALTLQTSYNNSGFLPENATNCRATWSVVEAASTRRQLVVTAKDASGPHAAEHCVKGTRRYELRGDKLVVP